LPLFPIRGYGICEGIGLKRIRNFSMRKSANYLKLLAILIFALLVSNCALYKGYYALSLDEKEQYHAVVDKMTVQQRMEYLQNPDFSRRLAYLESLGLAPSPVLGKKTAAPPVKKEGNLIYIPPKEVHLPPPSQKKLDSMGMKAKPQLEPFLQEEQKVLIEERSSVPPQENIDLPKIYSNIPLEKALPKNPQPEKALTNPKTNLGLTLPQGTEIIDLPMDLPKKQVPGVKSASPRVSYKRTGDPVMDVLTLLELYEQGKITKDQFEREKELAFQQTD